MRCRDSTGMGRIVVAVAVVAEEDDVDDDMQTPYSSSSLSWEYEASSLLVEANNNVSSTGSRREGPSVLVSSRTIAAARFSILSWLDIVPATCFVKVRCCTGVEREWLRECEIPQPVGMLYSILQSETRSMMKRSDTPRRKISTPIHQ